MKKIVKTALAVFGLTTPPFLNAGDLQTGIGASITLMPNMPLTGFVQETDAGTALDLPDGTSVWCNKDGLTLCNKEEFPQVTVFNCISPESRCARGNTEHIRSLFTTL